MGVTLVVLGEGCPGSWALEVTSRPSGIYCTAHRCVGASVSVEQPEVTRETAPCLTAARSNSWHSAWLAEVLPSKSSGAPFRCGQQFLTCNKGSCYPPTSAEVNCEAGQHAAPLPWAASRAPAAWHTPCAPAPASPQTPPTRADSQASGSAESRHSHWHACFSRLQARQAWHPG
jgi:hypothetical protein